MSVERNADADADADAEYCILVASVLVLVDTYKVQFYEAALRASARPRLLADNHNTLRSTHRLRVGYLAAGPDLSTRASLSSSSSSASCHCVRSPSGFSAVLDRSAAAAAVVFVLGYV